MQGKGISLTKEYLKECGENVTLFDGLESWFGGINTFGETMGVNIEQASRHPATLAMGLSTACWAHRRAGIRISPDFTYDFFTHKGVTL